MFLSCCSDVSTVCPWYIVGTFSDFSPEILDSLRNSSQMIGNFQMTLVQLSDNFGAFVSI